MQGTVRFGIVGTNFISDRFMEALKETDGVTATAVYSRAEETGRAFADKYGIPNVFTDDEAFCASDLIDAVYVASPTYCHCKHSVTALQNSKHVLCEKPLVITEEEYRQISSAAHGRVCLEAMRPRFSPGIRIILDALPRIGKIRYAHFDYCQYSSRYDAFRKGTVLNAFNPQMKNCALFDIGVYPIAVMTMLFGLPEKVYSRSTFLHNGFEGRGTVSCEYSLGFNEIATDFTATVNYSKIDSSVSPSYIAGEDGAIVIDSMNNFSHITLKTKEGTEVLFDDPHKNNMVYEIAFFRDAVTGKTDTERMDSFTEKELALLTRIADVNGIAERFK